MIFKNKYSPDAMFTFKKTRYRCVDWNIDTTHYPDEPELQSYLEKHNAFTKVEARKKKDEAKE